MITVSTKRLYSLGKIEASPKGLAITSNLSSGKEVEGTGGGVVRGGFMFHVFFYLPILMVGFFMISPPPPSSFSATTKSQCFYLFPNPPTGRL